VQDIPDDDPRVEGEFREVDDDSGNCRQPY